MSADNFLLVRRHPNGGWCFTMEFASSRPGSVRAGTTAFPTFDEAVDAAHAEEQRSYYEYGVSVDRGPAEAPQSTLSDLLAHRLRSLLERAGAASDEFVEIGVDEILQDLWVEAVRGPLHDDAIAIVPITVELDEFARATRSADGEAPEWWEHGSWEQWKLLAPQLGLGPVEFDTTAP